MRPRAVAALVVAVFAALALIFSPASALAKYEPPPHTSTVVDQAGALDDAAEARLAARLDAVRAARGYSIVVFLPRSLEGLTVQDVAYDTFNTWGVGAKDKDDGVLLVVAPTDRKMWIETGKGVGDRLTDVQASRIYREVMTPRLRAGDIEGAVDEGTKAIERALTGEDPVVATPKGRMREGRKSTPLTATQKWAIGGVSALVILLAIVSRTFRRVLFSILEVLLWAALLGRGGGGGGGGGGGTGGGGGRSGGGGAGGGW